MTLMSDNVVKLRPARPCPVCGKPASQAEFCGDAALQQQLLQP